MTARDDLHEWRKTQYAAGKRNVSSEDNLVSDVRWLCDRLDEMRQGEVLEAAAPPVSNCVYSPQWTDGLRTICQTAGKDGFGLSHVVPVTDYEWVAVFLRPGEQYQVTLDTTPLLQQMPPVAPIPRGETQETA